MALDWRQCKIHRKDGKRDCKKLKPEIIKRLPIFVYSEAEVRNDLDYTPKTKAKAKAEAEAKQSEEKQKMDNHYESQSKMYEKMYKRFKMWKM